MSVTAKQCAMWSGCVGGRLSPNCKLGFALGASALNKLQSATCRRNVQRKAIKSYDLLQIACACCVKSGSYHVLLCAPVPSRPTWCRLSPRWPGVKEESNVPCAPAASSGMLGVFQTGCSLSLWARWLWNSCCLLVVFVYSSTARRWFLAKVQHGALRSWLRQW